MTGIPKVAMVSGPRAGRTLSGRELAAAEADIWVRMISVGPAASRHADHRLRSASRSPRAFPAAFRPGCARRDGPIPDRASLGRYARRCRCLAQPEERGGQSRVWRGLSHRPPPVRRQRRLSNARSRRKLRRSGRRLVHEGTIGGCSVQRYPAIAVRRPKRHVEGLS